jgi:hypothetical protein
MFVANKNFFLQKEYVSVAGKIFALKNTSRKMQLRLRGLLQNHLWIWRTFYTFTFHIQTWNEPVQQDWSRDVKPHHERMISVCFCFNCRGIVSENRKNNKLSKKDN